MVRRPWVVGVVGMGVDHLNHRVVFRRCELVSLGQPFGNPVPDLACSADDDLHDAPGPEFISNLALKVCPKPVRPIRGSAGRCRWRVCIFRVVVCCFAIIAGGIASAFLVEQAQHLQFAVQCGALHTNE